MFKNFKYFKKLYVGNSIIGNRVSFDEINYSTKDKAITNDILANLFDECPTKFSGEKMSEKHYLLKDKWFILHELVITIDIIKKQPKNTFRYLGYFIKEMKNLKNTRKFYMHPTATVRYV